MKIEFKIGQTPAILLGEKSDKVFLYVHGMHGHKEEAEAFAEVACPKGYQVLGIDLPVMNKPWEVLPLLDEVKEYLYSNWESVSLRTNSVGTWFSLQVFQGEKVDKALFVSPLLDMRRFIENMPSREEDYYQWVLEHPVTSWNIPTCVLKPDVDLVVSDEVGKEFVATHYCDVTVMKGGEHWFHTPEQMAYLKQWEEKVLE